MTEIIIQRHGQSYGNRDAIFLGHTDLSLTEEGISQAKITAEYLKDEKIDKIYSSDLKRAYETALEHKKYHDVEIEVRKELREFYVGDWEGANTLALIENLYSEFKERRFRYDFAYPNGERTADGAERFFAEVLKIARENEGKKILIAAHAGVIRAFWFKLIGARTEYMSDVLPFMENCAISTLTYDGERLVPGKYNIHDFLPETDVHPR